MVHHGRVFNLKNHGAFRKYYTVAHRLLKCTRIGLKRLPTIKFIFTIYSVVELSSTDATFTFRVVNYLSNLYFYFYLFGKVSYDIKFENDIT